MLQLRFLRFSTGRLAAASHVLFCSVPAFCHCRENPSDAGVPTRRIWSLVVPIACVSSRPSRLNRVKSVPNSYSVVVSGLSFELPAWLRLMPVDVTVYVSYCALKRGRFPAVPREARSRKSSTYLTFQKGSCETRHTADTRPKGAHRFPDPNSE